MKTHKSFAPVSLARPGLVAVAMFLAANNALALVHYVSAGNTNATPPYTNWAAAAADIQEAVDVAGAGDEILVTNGGYFIVTVNIPLTLQSVNGPEVTSIGGGGYYAPCVNLTGDNVVVAGFTVTDGSWLYFGFGGGEYSVSATDVLTNCVLSNNQASVGGGAYGGTLNNCTLTGNGAWNFPWQPGEPSFVSDPFCGGGAASCTLNNCTLCGNFADCNSNYPGFGGGAYQCTLNNCTLTGNWAEDSATGNGAQGSGGGVCDCTLNNCIVYFNSAANGANYYLDPDGNYPYGEGLNYCCTAPMPTGGVGNIAADPLFLDYANGNLRLQSDSPCINAGNNADVAGGTDLDGHPRVVGGTVDIGAYEYQTPVSRISYAWLQQYGLPINANTDTADPDGTGMNLYQDWVAGLNPTDPSSVLQMLAAVKTNNPAGIVVTWESVNTRTYYLQRSTNLATEPAFTTIQSNLVGQAGMTSCTDTNAAGSGPYFYRVGVGN